MARGKQKLEAQKKGQERNQEKKGSQLEYRAAALKVQCPLCKVPLTSEKQLKEHYEARHPGKEIPKT